MELSDVFLSECLFILFVFFSELMCPVHRNESFESFSPYMVPHFKANKSQLLPSYTKLAKPSWIWFSNLKKKMKFFADDQTSGTFHYFAMYHMLTHTHCIPFCTVYCTVFQKLLTGFHVHPAVTSCNLGTSRITLSESSPRLASYERSWGNLTHPYKYTRHQNWVTVTLWLSVGSPPPTPTIRPPRSVYLSLSLCIHVCA